jgi:hypothetical protein
MHRHAGEKARAPKPSDSCIPPIFPCEDNSTTGDSGWLKQYSYGAAVGLLEVIIAELEELPREMLSFYKGRQWRAMYASERRLDGFFKICQNLKIGILLYYFWFCLCMGKMYGDT